MTTSPQLMILFLPLVKINKQTNKFLNLMLIVILKILHFLF